MKLQAEDKVEIQELSAKYAMAIDNSDLHAWLSTWTEQGIWEGAVGTFAGKDNLPLVLQKLAERLKGKRHVMTNFVIEGSGDTAIQHCYLLIVDCSKQTPPGVAIYTDKLKKIDGQWLFSHRTVKID